MLWQYKASRRYCFHLRGISKLFGIKEHVTFIASSSSDHFLNSAHVFFSLALHLPWVSVTSPHQAQDPGLQYTTHKVMCPKSLFFTPNTCSVFRVVFFLCLLDASIYFHIFPFHEPTNSSKTASYFLSPLTCFFYFTNSVSRSQKSGNLEFSFISHH